MQTSAVMISTTNLTTLDSTPCMIITAMLGRPPLARKNRMPKGRFLFCKALRVAGGPKFKA